jgi:uncharacterized protein (TIGR02145 family)
MRKIFHLILAGLMMVLMNNCSKDDDNDSSTITDVDGNVYHKVIIGTQTWMVENLKVTHYNDGSIISEITDNDEWSDITDGAYCNYDNYSGNVTNYGRLYNWYAVKTGKLAPKGWHVPTDAEYTLLENYLIAHGYNYDGTVSDNKIAKALASKKYWNTSSVAGAPGNTDYEKYRNKSGFTALPGGYRNDDDGKFIDAGNFGNWWTSSIRNTSEAWRFNIGYRNNFVIYYYVNKKCGFSVRCIKD